MMNDTPHVPDKVWAVTSGEYSDYRVHFVCLSEEVANEAAVRMDGAYVEPLDVVEGPEQVRKRPIYWVGIRLDGSEFNRSMSTDVTWAKSDVDPEPWSHPHAFERPRLTATQAVVSAQSYRSYDVALKAARDKLARLKAEREAVG